MAAEKSEAQLRDEIAMEKYGKKFDDLAPEERMSVGGTIGGRRGGEARKQQMAEQAGGDVSKAYSDMGQTGAVKGGYSTGYAHDEQKMKEVGATENRYETPPE